MSALQWLGVALCVVCGFYVYVVLTAVPDPEDVPTAPRSQDDDQH